MQTMDYPAVTGFRSFDAEQAAAAMAEFAETIRAALEPIIEALNQLAETVWGIIGGFAKLLLACQWLNKWLKEWRRLLRKIHIIPGPQRRHDLINRVRLQNSLKHLPESVVARFINGA